MHTGENEWDGSYWTVMGSDETVIAGGDPSFGCCTQADTENEDITEIIIAAAGEYIIRVKRTTAVAFSGS